MQVLEVVDCLASALGALAVVIFVTPVILIVAVPLAFGYFRVQNLYIATNRELKRLDSIALSPIFSKFSETLSGLITLRAFRKQEQFAEENKRLIDESNRAWWPMQVCSPALFPICSPALFNVLFVSVLSNVQCSVLVYCEELYNT